MSKKCEENCKFVYCKKHGCVNTKHDDNFQPVRPENNKGITYITNQYQGDVLNLPISLEWKPKEDITTFELAQCIPFLMRQGGIHSWEIDTSSGYMRHFDIYDPNQKP